MEGFVERKKNSTIRQVSRKIKCAIIVYALNVVHEYILSEKMKSNWLINAITQLVYSMLETKLYRAYRDLFHQKIMSLTWFSSLIGSQFKQNTPQQHQYIFVYITLHYQHILPFVCNVFDSNISRSWAALAKLIFW